MIPPRRRRGIDLAVGRVGGVSAAAPFVRVPRVPVVVHHQILIVRLHARRLLLRGLQATSRSFVLKIKVSIL